jgi:hypothetical protein
MARHFFLGDLSAWAMALGADETSVDSQSGKRVLMIPSASVTFWTAQTGGVQYTDLLDSIGTPITEATADDDGEFNPIQGPDTDPDTWYMWADGSGGAGPRQLVIATDMGDTVNALAATISDMAADAAALGAQVAASLGVVNYDTTTSSWPPRPAGDPRRFMWFGPTAPPVGGDYMVDGLDVFANTNPAGS